MGKLSSLLWSALIGAGAVYFMDPQNGDRRKALVRDQVTSLRSRSQDALDVGVRDLRNRVRGVLAEGMAMVSNEGVPDYVLEERLRARMGMFARHPGALEVSVRGGTAEIRGDVLEDEADMLMRGISGVRGIRGIDKEQLRTHKEAGNIPQLQGEGWTSGANGMWSPSTRLIAGTSAVYLILYSLFKGGLKGFLARLGGFYLGARALTNMHVRDLIGKGGDQGIIRVRKSIQIDAPVEEVYDLWSNFENFPRFMNNIENIRTSGKDRSHWVVKGPAGSKVEFDAITTDMIPNELVAWETTPDSTVKHSGQVRFRENQRGTQVNVSMAYTPPAGIAGHAVATLFGKDPKSEMDNDLARMKGLLEEGKTRTSKQKVTREEVMPVTGKSDMDDWGEGKKKSGKQSKNQEGMADTDVAENIRQDMGGGEENTHS